LKDKQTILIVDDCRSTLQLIKSILKDEYRIITATRGRDALAITQQDVVDLIILDIVMPDMGGYETCQELKDDPATRNIPVIFVSSMGEEEDEALGLELGAVDYIVKPIRASILKARVHAHMELKRQRDSLEALSMVDSMTGIPSRRQFETQMDKEWRRAVRSHETLAVFFIDVDSFKEYNDNHGHMAGDECIRQVAVLLNRNAKRGGDMVARYGGEEFAAFAPALSLEEALALGELFRCIVEQSSPVTISVGVTVMQPEQPKSPEVLLDQADQALYQAKNAGKNRVVAYSAVD